ncbi:MAG: AAA family ATPase [Sulfuricurvum sp.]|uniref:ATP-binding protein n=1 Tax=Sulfuricurvum sp. TaxID=2025608 RepID=UPI0026229B91|nr:AAA family ATPase [Sulfuricurvum sp.]MDD2829236.1 AAA family ATPase [Sulfuricurvum sp.]
MAIKIKRLKINNFKLFENFPVLEFNNPSLVVFDGPNGFGKTSFYDAIELLITGQLRRYSDLSKRVIDGRENRSGNPLINDQSTEGDLVIKGELEIDGTVICLMRKECRDVINTSGLSSFQLPLYSLSSFDNNQSELVENEQEFLEVYFGTDYIRNFEFLNYIEQEENIYLLKHKDKDRKASIAHLFNTEGFQQRINTLDGAYKKLGSLCNTAAKTVLSQKKSSLDRLLEELAKETEEVPHVKIISWKDINWDSQILTFPDEQYTELVGENGELFKLDFFITNFSEFQKKLNNDKLDTLLSEPDKITQILQFAYFFHRSEEFSSKLELSKSLSQWSQNIGDLGVVSAINTNKLTILSSFRELVKNYIDLDRYDETMEEIRKLYTDATALEQLLQEVIESRNVFVAKFMAYQSESENSSACPMCGFDWEDIEQLKKKFENQRSVLETLISSTGNQLKRMVDKFTNEYIEPLKKFILQYQKENYVDTQFVSTLQSLIKNRENLDSLYHEFLHHTIPIDKLLNKEERLTDTGELLETIKRLVAEQKSPIDSEKIRPYFSDCFLRIFEQKSENVQHVSHELIIQKIKYIQWQYSLHQNVSAQRLQQDYDIEKTKLEKADLLRTKLNKLKAVYMDSLKKYEESLIKNLEILFHIYSGRIAQDYQNGLGLFIKADANGIRFLEKYPTTHDYDAVFTMSSGQLATLIISFTLALNKRYSTNKLLLIDDPVQTLDELNIAGFINLLRYEFSDRQIFISTHEDMMSAYMRYKFQKFGLRTEHINFKDKYLEAQQ